MAIRVLVWLQLATLAAGFRVTNLRADRLNENDAHGVDRIRPLLTWAIEHTDGVHERGATIPTVTIDVRVGNSSTWRRTVSGNVRAVRYSGPPLPFGSRVNWEVCAVGSSIQDDAVSCTTATFLTDRPFGSSKWIAGRQVVSPKLQLSPKPVAQATATVTGLGFYELRLNGEKVGDAELDPGFSTNYTSRVLYATYDVTQQVTSGAGGVIVLAARVGAGKYSMAVSQSNVFIPGRSIFAFRAELQVTFKDGETAVLQTNSTWSVCETPPIVAEHLYHGEVYDARLETPGWDQPHFDPVGEQWSLAKEIQPLGDDVALSPRLFPPIRVVHRVAPVNVTQINAATWTFDLGNNFAGVAEIVLPTGVAAGHNITLVHTEYADIATTAGAPDYYLQQDTYTFSGKETAGQTYRATFVYHGFRYVRVDGYPVGAPRPTITGLFMHSDVSAHGNLTFNNNTTTGGVLNAIHSAVVQSQTSNLYSHPTDCPQREKRGWMGDAQWTAEEALLNFDMDALYVNWIRTMADVQETGCTRLKNATSAPFSEGANTNSYCCATPPGTDPIHPKFWFCSPQYNHSDTAGSIPDVVPNNWGNGGSRGWPGAPTWSVAYVIIAGHVLQYTRDVDLIQTYYTGIKAHVDFLVRQAKYGSGVTQFGMLGDWVAIEPLCPGSTDGCLDNPGWIIGDATTAFYFVKSIEDLISMAKVVGNQEDVAHYTELLTTARTAYHAVFFNKTSMSYGPTQTGNAMALAAGIPPDANSTAGAIAALVENIESRGTHLSVGAVGARWLLQALTLSNRTDLALDLAVQPTAPSWYDFILSGPGTLHETWDKAANVTSTCTTNCDMLEVKGAGYFDGTGDQPLPGSSSATSASECAAACLAAPTCVQMTWAPTHRVKCSLYTAIATTIPMIHNPDCLASAVKCDKGSDSISVCVSGKAQSISGGGSLNHIMLGGGIDPWMYHTLGGLRPPTFPTETLTLDLGVECEVMHRVRGATAETFIHGHRAGSSWAWSLSESSVSGELSYNATVPLGFQAILRVPKLCQGTSVVSIHDVEDQRPIWSEAESERTVNSRGFVRVTQVETNFEIEVLSGHFKLSIQFR